MVGQHGLLLEIPCCSERCPKPEPFFIPVLDDGRPKRGADKFASQSLTQEKQALAAATLSDVEGFSGLAGDAAELEGAGQVQRKHRRDGANGASGATANRHQQLPCPVDRQDQGGLARFLRQQQIDVDALVAAHMERIRAEALDGRRRLAARLAAAADTAVGRRVGLKEEEIARIGQTNAALEDRVRWLAVESMAWRDITRANEEAAAALWRDFDIALTRQQLHQHHQPPPQGDEGTGCAARAQGCPVCSCAKQTTVCINLFFTFPLIMNPVHEVFEGRIAGKRFSLWVRWASMLAVALVALLVPNFADFLSLVSSSCLLHARVRPPGSRGEAGRRREILR